ncbi:MAG: hypothetical protein ACR2P4_04540 [Gammaproteobacteria bacterium]
MAAGEVLTRPFFAFGKSKPPDSSRHFRAHLSSFPRKRESNTLTQSVNVRPPGQA